MADTDQNTLVDSAQKATAQANPIFSARETPHHLIPFEKIKRLGTYRPEERLDLLVIFNRLTSFIDSDYRLVPRQKLEIRLERTGGTKLTTEENPFYGDLGPTEQDSTLSLADVVQLSSDIARWLRANEKSESLLEFDSIDDWYWLNELSREEVPGFISNIIPKDKVAKLQRELFVEIWEAFKVGEQQEEKESQAPTGEVSGAKMPDSEALGAAVQAYQASGSSQSDASDGAQSEVTTNQLEDTEIFQEFLQTHTRELQVERENLLAMLEFEFYNNIRGNHTSAELDQIWRDLKTNFNEELYQFLLSNPSLTQQLLKSNSDQLRQTVFGQFVEQISTSSPELITGITRLYEQLGDELAEFSPERAEAFAEELKSIKIQGLSLDVIIGELPTQEILSEIKQRATIKAIPTKPPERTTSAATAEQVVVAPESELQKNATEYLATHAEYEIFKKTRIFLHKLSPELDLSAQNIRLQLQEFARREVLNLTETQLRLAQSDPGYLRSLYERFALSLTQQNPEIISFLIGYGRFINQSDPAEAAQFEAIYRNGVLGKTLSAKDALAVDLQTSLGGAATPVVVANTANTIEAMILEFGDKAPQFIEQISTERLELAFGLAAGTLTETSAEPFKRTLQSQLGLRLSELNLAVGGQFLQTGGLQGGVPSGQESTEQALGAIPQSRLLVETHGAATTIAALGTPATPVEKNHAAWWSSLPKEVQLQLYDQVEGAGAANNYTGFSSLPMPPRLGTYSNADIRKLLVTTWSENPQLSQEETRILQEANEILDARDRLAIQQVKVAKLREEVLAAVIQDIKDEQAALIAAQMGLAVAEGESNQAAIQAAMVSGAAPLAVSQLAGMNAAVSTNPNALVGTDPYTYDYGQDFSRQSSAGIKSQIAAQLRGAFAKKVKQKIAGSMLRGAAAKAGLAATGVGAPIALGLTLLQNKTARDVILGGGGLVIANTLYSLSTYGGALGAIAGGLIGGPVGAIIGANVGAMIPGLGGQWTGLMGWTPSAPVSPFASAGSAMSSGGGTAQSMHAMRQAGATGAESGAASTAAEPLSYAQQGAMTGAPSSSAAAGDALIQANPATGAAATSSSSLTGFLGATAATVTATAAPLIGIGIGIFLSLQVLFIIYGAFLIKVPSEGVVGTTEELSKYATLTKEASPATFANTTPTNVTYSIALAPKSEYQLQVTQVKDTYAYLGCDQDDCSLGLTSPISLESFPTDILSTQAETEYSVTISAVDTMVINSLTVTFDVFDSTGNKLVTGETITGSAAVIVGNPKVGCFLFATPGKTFQVAGGAISSQAWSANDQNMIIKAYSNTLGANPTFTKLLCAKGPITLYRLPSHNSYYGWAMGTNEIGFYSGTFSGQIGAEYTLVHELGHIIDYRNAGLRSTFISILPRDLHKCFDYPIGERCDTSGNSATGDVEAFAEAIARYVTNFEGYNLKQKHPKEHAWLKSNIFGGIEY
ncbi:MAG: hypothetical protein O2840_03045 [bacterium]|nr:hypothetical protein [bacterium]